MLDVAPGLSFTLALSLVVAISRFFIVMEENGIFFEAIGLFTPWFTPWFIAFLSSLGIGLRSAEIDKRANEMAANRLREEYSKLY